MNKEKTNRAKLDKVQSWLYESAKQSDKRVIEALNQVALSKNASCAQIALAWLLHKPGVVAPIVGLTSAVQLTENVGCLDIFLTEEDMQILEQHYAPHATPEYQ
ncbi:MAG: aldo/keto reductase [Francisellaceae bacterium]